MANSGSSTIVGFGEALRPGIVVAASITVGLLVGKHTKLGPVEGGLGGLALAAIINGALDYYMAQPTS